MLIIYRVFHRKSQKSYVGKSSRGLDRVREHFEDYSHPKREYRAKLLYRAMKKHGAENFLYEILFVADSPQKLNDKEKEFIIKFDSRNAKKGYNIAEGGTGGNMWEGISSKERTRRINKQIKNQKLTYSAERRRESSERMKAMRADPEKSKKNGDLASTRLKILNKIDPRFMGARATRIKCLENNTVYSSYKEAGGALGIGPNAISNSIKFNKKCKRLTFQKL